MVNLALAPIGASLDAPVSALQWILDAYNLVYASLLLSAGVGAALTVPTSLAILAVTYRDATERAQAIGIWQAAMALHWRSARRSAASSCMSRVGAASF